MAIERESDTESAGHRQPDRTVVTREVEDAVVSYAAAVLVTRQPGRWVARTGSSMQR